ncbi:MAG: FAD-dependent oxidoreductase, partial [Fluviibacter sp.]
MATPPMGSVAVIGGGWAGLACALKLAKAGYTSVVFESAPEAGGRARRAPVEGIDRD